jgi:epoxyqueuosine reductase
MSAADLKETMRQMALDMGFQQVHFTRPDVSHYQAQHWSQIEAGYHADMDWLERNTDVRYHPESLHPGTQTVILVRLDYLMDRDAAVIASDRGDIAQYAVGRDYHKVMRRRLTQLGHEIQTLLDPIGFRAFVDSAPVLERQLAEQSGMGWIGKNTLLLNEQAGSWFFLGELFLTCPIEPDPPRTTQHCGSCTSCLDTCPTDAFVKEGVLDAAKCISYLTIENAGPIPERYRKAIGNRIYGCDECQWRCPFTKFAPLSTEADFQPRAAIYQRPLDELWQWQEDQFLSRMEGSPIRRIGYQSWLRNIAVAMGNSGRKDWVPLLAARREHTSALVQEHIDWAIAQLNASCDPVTVSPD